jgi:hypothetical protein
MNLKKLVRIFYEARARGMWSTDYNKDDEGMRAVVESLREHVSSKEVSSLDYGIADVRDKFNAILGVENDDN